ncbi:hypothetical protein F5Y18DRAFT_407910 [Xylariaceae sp. FL1019]|nr:hypothetical protein F5Y18DRAFT_407910 [Xylariaceae sp. FL1019]
MSQENLARGSSKSGQTLQSHQVLRAAALAVGIITARHLFVNGFHYPYLMLLAHASIALIVESLGACRDEEDHPADQRPIWPHSWTTRFYQAAFAVSAGLGIFFAYHSLLHNRNTTLWVMLLAIDWSAIISRSVTWCSSHQAQRRTWDVPLSAITILLCLLVLLWKDNWLIVKGTEMNLLAALSTAIARHLWNSGRVESPVITGPIRMDAYVSGVSFCQVVNVVLLLCAGLHNRRDFHVHGRIVLIVVNTVASVVALQSNASLRKLTSSFQLKVTRNISVNYEFGSIAFGLFVILLVEIDNCVAQHRPSRTSITQWIAFIIANLTTLDAGSITPMATQSNGEQSYMPLPVPLKTPDQCERQTPILDDAEAMNEEDEMLGYESSWLRRVSLAWQAALSSLTLLLVVYCAIGVPRTETHELSWDLDIVIAWYDEPIEQVIRTSQLALELPNLAGRKVRTIVYNKGTMNQTELEQAFPHASSDLIVRPLENFGREGNTYLTHVINKEQDWASHTMFVQAEPHEPEYLQARLRDYFIQNTGFLSLSYVRNFCASCDDCNDHSGWSGNGTLIRDIFDRSNPNQECQDLSMTYRGQFVVSAKRMQQANQKLLKDLRDKVDESDEFGYVLERMWSTIFRCPTISEKCPTLLSGWVGNLAAAADCQCLDVESESTKENR